MHLLLVTVLCASGALGPTVALADSQPCAENTGLNPACPLTAAGLIISDSELTDTAAEHDDTLVAQDAWGQRNQLGLQLPLHEHLAIAGVGDADGTGDADFSYNRVLTRSDEPFAQVVGAALIVPSGAVGFTSGYTEIAPLYTVSYAPLRWLQLLGEAQYTLGIGGTRIPSVPRAQTLRLSPRAIVDLWPHGAYASVAADVERVTGGYRYDAYDAGAVVGVVRHRYNLSASYRVPLDDFSRAHVFEHVFGLQLLWEH